MIDEGVLKQNFSAHLKLMMEERGISENAISHESGISQSAINRIKNGSVSPTLFQAVKIAAIFKVNIESFLVSHNNINSKYIPIVNSEDFISSGSKNLEGFYSPDEEISDAIGFKYDRAFSCKLLNKSSVVIIKKALKNLTSGTTVLFVENKKYKIGNYSNGNIKPIDDLTKTFSLNNITILGTIVKIETAYIKEQTLIDKVKDTIGSVRLSEILDKRLNYSFS